MLSFWEKEHFLNYDLIVVGAGIVGLSTAIQYKLKYPQSRILILERGIFPSGASTKNAGFACFGSLTEILDDLSKMSEEAVLSLVQRRYQGLLAIREIFGDEALGYKPWGGLELITENELSAQGDLEKINNLLRPLFGEDVFELVEDIVSYGFGKEVKQIVRNKFEGELDTGKYIQALWDKCQALGIKILTGATVVKVDLSKPTVEVKDPITAEEITFKSKKLGICTNAFAKEFFPELDINPGRGLVMVSRPLVQDIPWKGSFHYDKGYVYFRKVGENRLLIGGGRNIDFNGEQSDTFDVNPVIKDYLLKLTEEVIFPEQNLEFDMEWTGIMAFGATKSPIIKKIGDHVGVAVRLGGMGVAVGWQAGSELVDLL